MSRLKGSFVWALSVDSLKSLYDVAMTKRAQILVTLFTDAATICLSWLLYYAIRVQSGLMYVIVEPDLLVPMLLVWLYWSAVFFVVGLYKPWYAASRFDELALIFKSITLGCLFLFFAVFFDDQGSRVAYSSRLLIAMYWGVLLLSVSFGRLALRSFQRRMLIAGIGAHKTIIVGNLARCLELFREVIKFPALGYRVVGFVPVDSRTIHGGSENVPILGYLPDLHSIIAAHDVKEVLIALDSSDHDRLLDIMTHCNSHAVGLKIIPDLYDIISGQARTNAISGFPLIEISPRVMSQWEEVFKRVLDVAASSLILLLGFPFWMFIAILVKLESPGPVLYKQERVGRDGERFSIIKFRSMREDAEKAGPQWADKKDPRITRLGKWLRKLHLDEMPQFINVLNGHMSLVGPRPERPVFVESLSKEIPLYTRRLKVRPGITGWAQVKHRYDETIEDVR
ncbi:MAG TPA: sugar transferase, partial [Bacteroidetes bacterium]|nr:sugar transferase [Bacteroidota bacterium]